GLIRYDSLAGLEGEPKRMLRPRLVAYGLLLLAAIVGLITVLTSRTPFEANVLRIRGTPYVLEEETIRNQFELHLVNKNPHPTKLRVKIESPVEAEFTLPTDTVSLESLQSYRLPVFVRVRRENYQAPFELRFRVTDESSAKTRVSTGTFMGPRTKP